MERNDSNGHHAEPNHGQSILPSEKTRVEEPNTRNHDPHESGGGENPSNVSEVIDPTLARIRVEPLQRPRYSDRMRGVRRMRRWDMEYSQAS